MAERKGSHTIHTNPNSESSVDPQGRPVKDMLPLLSNDHLSPVAPSLYPLEGTYRNHRDILKDLTYLAATRDLEIDSKRTRLLQGYVDTMVKGESVEKTRVIVMKKGENPEAFTFPDGTICINQALINALDTMDEIGGILGHEVGHLIDRTFETESTGRELEKFGVCWAHEIGSDVQSPRLAEKAGLKSTGLASAIQKISPNERGAVHQSGDMRAAQGMAVHLGLHYATSDQDETPIPSHWKTEHTRPTNLEIANEIWKKEGLEHMTLTKLFSHLNGRDLASVKAALDTREHWDAFQEVVTNRLHEEGFTHSDITHFLIAALRGSYGYYVSTDARIIHSPDEAVELTEDLLDLGGRMHIMHEQVFHETYEGSYPVDFIRYFSRNLFPDDGDQQRGGVPITQEALIKVLTKINKIQNFKKKDEEDMQRAVETSVYEYVKLRYIDPAEQTSTPLDRDGLRDFFEQVHSAELPLTENGYRDMDILVSGCSEERKELVRQGKDVLDSVLGIESLEARVETFFAQLEQENFLGAEAADFLEIFFKDIKCYFEDHDLDDAGREQHVQVIIDRFGQHKDKSRDSVTHFLAWENAPLSDAEKQQNEAISRLNLQMLAAVNLYDTNGAEFSRAVANSMNTAQIDLQELSDIQILTLCAPLLNQHPGSVVFSHIYGFQSVGRIDSGFEYRVSFEDIFQLPYIQEVFQRRETASIPDNIRELFIYTTKSHEALKPFYEYDIDDIFSDSPISLIYFQDIRQAFLTILKKGVAPEDGQYLYSFINKFLSRDPITTGVLRQIVNEELQSYTALAGKIRFLEKNFEMLGPEGLISLGQEITTMEEYMLLRSVMAEKSDEYLHPKKETTIVAGGDFATAFLTKKFDMLLETSSSDPEAQREISTSLADHWLDQVTNGNITSYNVQTNHIILYRPDLSPLIRSVKDIVYSLHDLPDSQRTALVMKALMDVDGGLTTVENREKLGQLTIDALRLGDRFINRVLPAACDVADPKIVGYPLSVLFAPLLFRGLTMEKIDIGKMLEAQAERAAEWREHFEEDSVYYNLSEQDIFLLLNSSTKEIVEFGSRYEDMEPNGSDSLPYKLAQKNKDIFYEVSRQLEHMVLRKKVDEATKESQVDSGTEAVIRAVQASGAVGVRALQLARQLLEFSPEVDSRLSETFDANPGLSKLLLWENLYHFKEKSQTDKRYAEVGKFVEDQLVSVSEKLGGGSLYTAYAAKVRGEDGVERESVIKMLNPNAALMIKSFYTLAVETLERVKETGSAEDIYDAEKALMLVEMAQQWCLADINDPSFERDDDRFREIIKAFNDTAGSVVTAPKRIFTGYLLKSEERASGRTLNAVLNDDALSVEQKQVPVRVALDFFDYQLSYPVSSHGKEKEYLVQSDPHPGNFIIQEGDEGVQLSIIDRNMFLHLNESEAKAMRNLWSGNKEAFFREFIGSIFDYNKVRSPLRKLSVGKDISHVIQEEITRVGGEQYVDSLHLMHKVMERLHAKGLAVPLHMHLAIKNVFALQELKRRYKIT